MDTFSTGMGQAFLFLGMCAAIWGAGRHQGRADVGGPPENRAPYQNEPKYVKEKLYWRNVLLVVAIICFGIFIYFSIQLEFQNYVIDKMIWESELQDR